MATQGEKILKHLSTVGVERAQRERDGSLKARVVALKTYQQRRFAYTYEDLLASRRYSGVARFFLDELYGPRDFGERDEQFARVVPALIRLFPGDVLGTVESLAELHALSESLDTAMARVLPSGEVHAEDYLSAWQSCERRAERTRQVTLTMAVGRSLDVLTRKMFLRQTLRMMRGPARAAGLASLQGFLETGFDTFHAMGGADEFLQLVNSRESALMEAMFDESVLTREAMRDAALDYLP